MTNVNSVVLIGRLVRDPEPKYTTSGLCIVNGCIVVNTSQKNGDKYEDKPNFIDFTMFGKMAETVSQYMIKGKQVAIAGELVQDTWESEGQKRSKLKVIARQIELLGSKQQGGDVV